MKLLFALTLVALIVGPSSPVGEMCIGAHAALMAQGQHRPEPGNPGHKRPPENWYCSTHDPDEAKRCACHRVDTDPLCEGEPSEDRPKCKVSCFKTHCHCLVHCVGEPEKDSGG